MDTVLEWLQLQIPAILESHLQAILLHGSRAKGTEDQVSDYDILILLKKGVQLEHLPNPKSWPFWQHWEAAEFHLGKGNQLIRMYLQLDENIIGLDLSIQTWDTFQEERIHRPFKTYRQIWGEEIKLTLDQAATTPSPSLPAFHQEQIDRTWFLLYESLKKFRREDHLIGMHLLMEVQQEYLVLLMKMRDVQMGTHIHRFGQREQLPAIFYISEEELFDFEALLLFFKGFTRLFDDTLQRIFPSYQSKLPGFQQYINSLYTK
ncbi:MAG: nucleotidyltransferase domain-containing protein [Bacteroidota bacterium]